MIANVKIEQDKENPYKPIVFKDGEEIKGVNGIDLTIEPNGFPRIDIGIVSRIVYEGISEVYFNYFPEVVEESCKILREELLKHGDLYNGFLESMKSVIQESERWEKNDWVCNSYDEKKEDLERLAELMLKRIIGED